MEIDAAVTAAGAVVSRMDFPYRRAGRRAPDRPPILLNAVAHEAGLLAQRCKSVFMGGRSMGGRICSMYAPVAAESIAGLVLVSYPLHPPGRPDRLRTEHFPAIRVPCLFVSGTRDAFGSPAELEQATASIAGPVRHVWFEGKDHSLRGVDSRVAEVAVEWMSSL